jgi:copper chaperone CopZ
MKCGGCVGHVKKLLEEHPAVLHATVNLATETALVRVSLAAGADLDKLAADLAKVGNMFFIVMTLFEVYY